MKFSQKIIAGCQIYFLLGFLVIWILFWIRFNILPLEYKINYYKFAAGASAETLRAYHAVYDKDSLDYYSILKFCDNILPPSAELQIVLPKEPAHKFMFLREKGRYILYPRNYGDNDSGKDYILVYGQKDYLIPQGYKIIKMFDTDKYLLEKTKI